MKIRSLIAHTFTPTLLALGLIASGHAMAQEKLRVEATGVGASGGSGTFGASVVARVREHN